jgi:drug/metabolite transporter (DMT)-like permease
MSDRKALRLGPVEWALLVFLSVLWGGSFFFVEVIVEELPAFTLVLGRVGIAAAVLWILVLAGGGKVPREPRAWRDFLVVGALNNVAPFALIAWAQTHMGGGLAAIINASTPLWTVIFASFMTTDEKATALKIAGVLVGMAGVAVIVGPAAFGIAEEGLLPPLAIVAATILYGYTSVYGRRLRSFEPIVAAAGQLTAASFCALPLALLLERPWSLPMPSGAALASLLGLAVLSTALAYAVYFRILNTAGATNVILVTLLVPITAVLLGAAFLGERLEPRAFFGMALVAVGLALIDGRLVRSVFAGRRGEHRCSSGAPRPSPRGAESVPPE